MYNSDLRSVVQRLRAEFREKTKPLGNKNEAGTKLNQLQTEFSYIINDIQRGPSFAIPKLISDCEKLMQQI